MEGQKKQQKNNLNNTKKTLKKQLTERDKFGIISKPIVTGGHKRRKKAPWKVHSDEKNERSKQDRRKEWNVLNHKVNSKKDNEKLSKKVRVKIKLKSLILAQDERWRRA